VPRLRGRGEALRSRPRRRPRPRIQPRGVMEQWSNEYCALTELHPAAAGRRARRLPKMIVARLGLDFAFFLRQTSDAGNRQIGESLVPLAF
jgi:hypothetical protein